MTEQYSEQDRAQLLARLQREQEELRQTLVLVSAHREEFIAAIKRKSSHVVNIGGLIHSFALGVQAANELGEALAGREYRDVLGQMERFEQAVARRLALTDSRIDELRSGVSDDLRLVGTGEGRTGGTVGFSAGGFGAGGFDAGGFGGHGGYGYYRANGFDAGGFGVGQAGDWR